MDVLSKHKYASQVAIKSGYRGETEVLVGDMIKRINRTVEARWSKNADSDEGAPGTMRIGRTPITGWDWMELIPEFSTGHSIRRNARSGFRWFQRAPKPNWLGLTDKIPLFLGQDIGEVLKPAQTGVVCGHWYPLPGGLEHNYLAASIRCLEKLSRQCGKGDDICTLFHKQVWKFRDESIFRPCVSCMQNPPKCTKQPQALVKQRTQDILPVLTSWSTWRDGAVIFGLRRKTDPNISLGYWESERDNITTDGETTRKCHDENSTCQEAEPPTNDPVATSIPEQGESDSNSGPHSAATNQTTAALVEKAHRDSEWAITWVRDRWQIFVILVLTAILIAKDSHISRELATYCISWVLDWWQTVIILVLAGLLLKRGM